MSPLVWKELRLLGPSWLLGFVAVTSLWWLPLLQPGLELAGVFLFLGAAAPFLVALNALGREIGLGTFSAMFNLGAPRWDSHGRRGSGRERLRLEVRRCAG